MAGKKYEEKRKKLQLEAKERRRAEEEKVLELSKTRDNKYLITRITAIGKPHRMGLWRTGFGSTTRNMPITSRSACKSLSRSS